MAFPGVFVGFWARLNNFSLLFMCFFFLKVSGSNFSLTNKEEIRHEGFALRRFKG